MIKIITKRFLILITLFCITYSCCSQGVSINTTGNPAHASAILDVSSSNCGVLIPRMTKLQRNSINLPAIGLLIYQIDDTTGFWYYDGVIWKQVGVSSGIAITQGSNTGNTLYWDGSKWVDTPNLYNDGGAVGIGTNAPDNSAAIEIN
ncbi:MAG TPA: hypothetical protein P5250_00740, partial [Bacteroidales bacterium]|nr:hypothetical protein [Bacteroidales bacterium]